MKKIIILLLPALFVSAGLFAQNAANQKNTGTLQMTESPKQALSEKEQAEVAQARSATKKAEAQPVQQNIPSTGTSTIPASVSAKAKPRK